MKKHLSLLFTLIVLTCASARAQSLPTLAPPADAALPRIGILVPVGPPDYAVILDVFKKQRTDTFGEIAFQVGTLYDLPVVLSFAPGQGPLLRSLAAASMFEHYNIKTVIYPGTSGAHLGPAEMRIGDIVLGAKNVDFGNYAMAKDGSITGGQFGAKRKYGNFFADPALLRFAACSATRVAAHTALPAWDNTSPLAARKLTPDIFYFGIQGTSTTFITNLAFMKKLSDVFGMIDEDGDWYSNLAAALYHVPFIEVSVISNSIPEYPDTAHGEAAMPAGTPPTGDTNYQAQRISNRIAIDLIQHYGAQMLAGTFTNPGESPYPAANFTTPKNPQQLLDGMDCK
jgi:adenosylhomocysteine nucleosidase